MHLSLGQVNVNYQAKVNYLIGGLSAGLTTKMYVMKIDSPAKFLEALKLEDEA